MTVKMNISNTDEAPVVKGLRVRESDGRLALRMDSKASVTRQMKRDQEREERRKELEALYGDMADCFA